VTAGQSGLGKSTLVNSLFTAHLMDPVPTPVQEEGVSVTTEIRSVSYRTPPFGLCDGSDGGEWRPCASQPD
jgi:hypothetical protein